MSTEHEAGDEDPGDNDAGEATAPSCVVGIDLGTTHCALSYVDLDLSEGEQITHGTLPVPQVVAPGEVESRELLASFAYLPHSSELKPEELQLPWPREQGQPVVGELARRLGARTPIRLVSSAKSWLCHPGVDRRSALLPLEAPEDVARLSPLDAAVRYLEHLRSAWDLAHPEAPLREQNVTLTVPASFDPAARDLTVEAAKRAGLSNLTLLEEPQAAVYSWLQRSAGAWREQVQPGDVVLVVDVGGGTSDFSLISVTEADGSLALHRVAVGEHTLLGGDNMDLTLAYALRARLEADGKHLDSWQMRALTLACRSAKEILLSDSEQEAVPIVVPSRGSKLVGSSLRAELTRADVNAILLDGFFPRVAADARPKSRTRAALTELGLPYAQDPGITRHLAAFLARQAESFEQCEGGPLRPSAVLFNGGVFRAPVLVERMLCILNGWLEAADAPPARVLEGADLDLACSRGAAYYGYARARDGVRIRGGTARSFYVGVEAAMPAVPGLEPPITALCVAPFGLEEGCDAEPLEREFGLVVGEPVKLRFFGSSVRRDDVVGTALERWSQDELEELEALDAELEPDDRPPGEVVPVQLQARVTEVGALELFALPRGNAEPWKVEFDVRGDR